MSLFLGKIHYWLFNKIVWFEGLEEEVIKLAEEKGINIDILQKEINKKYGEKLPNLPLEEMIDQSNIHGWLQGKINSAEGRLASWTVEILNSDKNSIYDLEKIYINQGISAAIEAKKEGKACLNAVDIFNTMNDYILDGMPCDRVNEVIHSEESIVKWKRRVCVHNDIWTSVSGDVKIFYHLRDLWIKSFVNEINKDFEYINEEEFVIRRK